MTNDTEKKAALAARDFASLMKAVSHRDDAKIKRLIAKTPSLAREKNEDGHTALMAAATDDLQVDCLRALLRFSDAKAVDQDGLSALMLAAANGSAECVKALLPVSDARASDAKGSTALIKAAEDAHAENVAALLPVSDANAVDRAGRFALTMAFGIGTFPEPIEITRLLAPATSRRLIENGKGDGGLTALMLAAREGAAECVKLLLPHSRPNKQCESGETALVFALRSGWSGAPEAIRALLAVSDPNKENPSGENALFAAVARGDVEFVRFLFPLCEKKGNAVRMTALDMARMMERPAVIDVFAPIIEPEELPELVKTHGAGKMPQAAARLESMELHAEIRQAQDARGTPGVGASASALASADGGSSPRKGGGRL